MIEDANTTIRKQSEAIELIDARASHVP